MSYQSFGFILFVSIVLLVYYTIGRKKQLWVLAIANLAFYAVEGFQYIPFILVTIITTFLVGKKIGNIYEEVDKKLVNCIEVAEKKQLRAEAKTQAKKVLLIGIFVTIILLVMCKYTNFIVENINSVLTAVGAPQIAIFQMILPLGISFYSFMALSYVLDIYWKRYKAEQSFLMYAVYLSYFPHVVQGPIDRFNEFKVQVEKGIKCSYKDITYGAQLAVWGFFKKLVIADRLDIFVDDVFSRYRECYGSILIIAVAVYSIQIYTDFSGCIDIVTGVSEMFGIRLRKNFNHPYFAKTMAEFWRRWHISLQEWFKDYIYFPVSTSSLTKNVKKHYQVKEKMRAAELFASCFPVFVVWMVTGIWHGAAWKFVIWGMYHAMLLIGSNIFAPICERVTKTLHLDTENFGWRFWQMSRTYILCCIGRVFFRAAEVESAFVILKKMFLQITPGALFRSGVVYGIEKPDIVVAVVAVFVLWVVDMLQERMKIRDALAKQNIVFRWIIIYIGIFSVIIFGIYGPGYNASGFIYQQF